MARFLAKVLLALEPSIYKDDYHEALREISAHNRNNLLDMIGVDPIVYRTESDAGTIDLQIWITTITGSNLNRMILPFYYTGARKYIFMCSTMNAYNFVTDLIDLTSDQLNALNEIVILTKTHNRDLKVTKLRRDLENYFQEKSLENYSFFKWTNQHDLQRLFDRIVDNLIANISEATGFAPIGFNLGTVEEMIQRQGYEINENHEVIIQKRDYVFRVDLKKNAVYAEMKNCYTCEKECRVSKKLCIVISDKGFANISGLGDLRVLSIIFAIEDESIFNIKGQRPKEDISFQLKELKEMYKKKCEKE